MEFDFFFWFLTECPPYPVPKDCGDHAQDDLPAHRGACAGLSAAPAALAQDADKDCADFGSQAEAQAYFEANGGSPTNNVDNLDADHDGQACEAFDYGGGGGDDGSTGGGGNGGGNGDLPSTGPNDTLLSAGTALLLAGLALVGVPATGPGTLGARSEL